MISLLLLIVSVALALFVNTWWWLSVGFLTIWIIYQWYRHNGRPWRKIHFKATLLHAACAGYEDAKATAENRDFDTEAVLNDLVKRSNPDWKSEDIRLFVDREYDRCRDFYDEQHIRHELVRITKKLPMDRAINEFIDSAKKTFNTSDNGFMLRMVIAGLIEDQYGSAQRGEYMLNVLRGKAT